MENTNEVTVQIKVEDYNSEFYCTDYGFIPKSACIAVLPPSVEETEGEVKGFVLPEKWFCTKNQYADSWMGYMLPSPANYFNSSKHWSKNIATMQMYYKEITNDQFFDHVFNKEFPSDIPIPEPERTLIGVYEGVEIFEDTKAWFVDLEELRIYDSFHSLRDAINRGVAGFDSDTHSKIYLNPEEADKRLKEECEKKSNGYRFTADEVVGFMNSEKPGCTLREYATKLIEKQYSVIYLTPNTESK